MRSHPPASDDGDPIEAILARAARDAEVGDGDALVARRRGRGTGRDRSSGWLRVARGNRALWTTAGIAVLALVAGLVLGRFVVSPGQAAADAEPPAAGAITVPVEERELSNDVTLRGDAVFADAVDVAVETVELAGPPIVTGQVPQVGATLDVRSVALEVTGRPLLVLPGELPTYRTLRIGLAGPDVLQLNQALAGLGLGVDPASTAYDASTAAAVRALYEQVGYPLPDPPAGAAEALAAAEAAVADANAGIEQAQAALQAATAGPTEVERQEQDNLVNAALRELEAAQAAPAPDAIAVAALSDAYALALLRRDEALAPGDAPAERLQVEQAQSTRTRAQQDLAAAQLAVQPTLPASEVLFLTDLPRRVDAVMVERGSTADGTVMSVSGATLAIEARATPSDAALLEEGAVATFALPDGSEATATVASVGGQEESSEGAEPSQEATEGEEADDRIPIVLTPQELDPGVVAQLQGTNVRISIPVEATAGAVLAVPIAALTAGPGGESRVEVATQDEDGRDETRLVEVTTGLAAEGFVEVAPVLGERLEVGDLVVVGR